MKTEYLSRGMCITAGALMLLTAQVRAERAATTAEPAPATAKDQGNKADDHAHGHGADDIYRGLFDDAQIRDRTLADWQGDWQSVYPLLQDGTLDPVMDHKARDGKKTAAEYRAKYETGYRTDVDRIQIDGSSVTFHRGDQAVAGEYQDDGHETLTYDAGNRGVRYVFRKVSGDDDAPDFIQFSDHGIFPQKAGHYHLYWGDDRAALLKEITNWPTYYPSNLTGAQVAAEMMAH